MTAAQGDDAMPSAERARADDGLLARELSKLRTLTVGELQDRYLNFTGRESRSFNRDYLCKRVAWHMQEALEGGLPPEVKALAAELARESSLRSRPRKLPELPKPPPSTHPADPRLPVPGSVLRKEHAGEVHEITVLDKGFEYRGEHYRSLSRIAKLVTGTAWNGFLWLGLTSRKPKSKAKPARKRR